MKDYEGQLTGTKNIQSDKVAEFFGLAEISKPYLIFELTKAKTQGLLSDETT
jgi:hypothetical protein